MSGSSVRRIPAAALRRSHAHFRKSAPASAAPPDFWLPGEYALVDLPSLAVMATSLPTLTAHDAPDRRRAECVTKSSRYVASRPRTTVRGFLVARSRGKAGGRAQGEGDCTKCARHRSAGPFSRSHLAAPRA